MNNYSYFPYHLRVKRGNLLLYVRFIVAHFLHSFKSKPRHSKEIDIIVDDWSNGVVSHFYGEEIISRLGQSYRYDIIRFSRIRGVNLKHVFQQLFNFFKCMFLAESIIRKHKMDLREYVFAFFSEFMSGQAIRETYKPKLVITGHQNGFSSIKAKAAGAEIILIPNGLFGYFGDTSFKYADYFISIGAKYFIEAALKFGCVFKNIYSFGPLRVYNFNQKTKNREFKVIYDLLWVGFGTDLLSNYSREGYTIKAEHEAIKLINKYASKGWKVAYHCRHEDDVEKLGELGLLSDKIDYLPPTYSKTSKKTKNIYEAVRESGLIMSSLSGVCHEAYALGKKMAFVNLSGNSYLNYPYRSANVEYDLSSKTSFDEFVERIKNKNIDRKDYVEQNHNYIEDLFSIVDNVLNKGEE